MNNEDGKEQSIQDAWKILQEALDVLDDSKQFVEDQSIPESDIIVFGDLILGVDDLKKYDDEEDDAALIESIQREMDALFPEKSISYTVPDYDPDQVDLHTELVYNELIKRVNRRGH